MFSPKTNYAKIAYDAILFFVSTSQVKKPDESKISADLKLNRACFVSIYNADDSLRCRFGGIFPQNKNLYDEIIENSINASKDKPNPIKAEDLNQIKVHVDVISGPNSVDDFGELKPHKHGLFIKDKSGNSGYILPNKKGVKTFEQQIETIKKESGITGDIQDLEIQYFKTTKYD